MKLIKNFNTTTLITVIAMTSVSTWAALPMKPGLWEVQPTMQSQNNTHPMPNMGQVMQNMPPQMRSQMEAMMQKQGMSMSNNGNIQICLTQDMIEHNRLPQKNDCESTVTHQSGNKYLFHFSCGNPPTIGDGEIVFQNNESYTSQFKVTHQVQGQEHSMNMESSAKWLNSDCGKLQPSGN